MAWHGILPFLLPPPDSVPTAFVLMLTWLFCCQALDDELKGPMEVVEMSRERAQRLALQEASIAVVTSLLPALEPVEQASSVLCFWLLAVCGDQMGTSGGASHASQIDLVMTVGRANFILV